MTLSIGQATQGSQGSSIETKVPVSTEEKALSKVSGAGIANVASVFEKTSAAKTPEKPAEKPGFWQLKPGTGSAAAFGFSLIGGGLAGLVGGAVIAGAAFGPIAGIVGGVLGAPVGLAVGGALYVAQLFVRQKLTD